MPYEGLIDGFVYDKADEALDCVIRLVVPNALATQTVMTDETTKAALARDVISFAEQLSNAVL